MRFSLRLRALLLVLALTASPAVWAQVAPPTGVAWDLVPALAPAPTDAPLAGEVERFLVDLDAAAFTDPALAAGDALRLALPDGPRTFSVTRVARHRPGTVSVTALAGDGSGEIAVLTYGGGGVVGAVSDGDALYQMLPTAAGTALARMDPAGMDILACGVDGHDHRTPPPGQAGRAALTHDYAAPAMTALADGVEDPITIDLLIPYTAAAEEWAIESLGSIDAVIAQSLALSQLALDNSRTGLTLRVVHAYRTNYDESIEPPEGQAGGASSWHLRRLTASPSNNPWGDAAAGFMEEVHGLRNQYGADLVTMFARISDVGGIAWLLSSIQGAPDFGFSVNRVQQIASVNNYTLVHEIGHNMGIAHGRDQPSAEAPLRGGIFPYSVGWRWEGEDGRGFNSVMSYGRPGDVRAPHFSNPDVTYVGGRTGTANLAAPFGPADAARSIREVKRLVASYRPTRVAPPAAALGEPIALEINSNDVATGTLAISNTGASDLVWELDLAPAPATAAATLRAYRGAGEEALALEAPAPPEEAPLGQGPSVVEAPGSLSPSALVAEGDLLSIYTTTFTVGQGFAVGKHQQRALWTSRTNAAPFEISTENPSEGSQHLRLAAPEDASAAFVYSPYFGAWPTGHYELSVDLSISASGGPAYFLRFLDGRGRGVIGGWAFSGGNVFAYNPETGSFTGIEQTWTAGVYERYTVVVDPEARRVRYLIGADEVASRPIEGGGTGIGQLYVIRNSGAGSDHLDLDNLTYQSFYRGLLWARPDLTSGVIGPGEQDVVTFTFPAPEVEPGSYSAEAVLRSNDPASPVLRVPISLEVSGQVSTEGEALAQRTRLMGNHPNPFHGATRVAYALARPGHVTLEVFTVTGQRVAVLADAYQAAGTYEVPFETDGLASGVYVYRLRAGDTVDAGRMLLLR